MSRIARLLTHCLAIFKERGVQHGDFERGHELLGVVWGAILTEAYPEGRPEGPIPGEKVCLMLAALKILRAARPGSTRDSFVDAINYTAFAEAFREDRK